jgi:hypothetical protein
MRSLHFGCRPAPATQRLVEQGGFFSFVCVLVRRCASAAADVDASLIEEHTAEKERTPDTKVAEAVTVHEPRRPLVVSLLPYIYSANTDSDNARLALPQGSRPLQRMKDLMSVDTKSDLAKALEGATLTSEDECVRYVNLVVAYIHHKNIMQQQEDSHVLAVRKCAERSRKLEKTFYLTPAEQHVLLKKACTLVEQRRVPIVVASRLLQHRWPTELRTNGGSVSQRYVMELLQSWIAEELRKDTLAPRDARALLSNCMPALKSQAQLQARTSHRAGNGVLSASARAKATRSQLSSLVGSLASTAVSDINSPGQAEGLISVLWDVHLIGCAAPPSFWDAMLRRVVQFNSALEDQLTEPTKDGAGKGGNSGTTSDAPKKASSSRRPVGHFFSTLTTRQIYRLLLVLKLSKYAGDATALHQLADQALRNIAFELEATRFNGGDASPHSEAGGEKEGEKKRKDSDGCSETAASPSVDVPSTTTTACPPPLPSTTTATGDTVSPVTQRRLSKRGVTRRIRRVTDMRPHELLELLSLASDLGASFGVSASRVSAELLTPLVPYLSTKELLLLLQSVRHTQSQSTELLQAVMSYLMEKGPNIPYAMALSKTLIRTAATAPEVFAALEMESFVHFFLDLCEAQFCLCRSSVVTGLAELLYALGRRYGEPSPPGQRIRAVVNLFCAHVNRLLQLKVISVSSVEPLLEVTVLLRMRLFPEQYPAVQELLRTRAAVAEQQQAHQAAMQERRLRYIDASAAAPLEETSLGEREEWAGRRAPRWEDLTEAELPSLPKAALCVYSEFAYMFERMVVVRAKLTATDFTVFERDISRAGLYSLLQGVQLFHLGHLRPQVTYTADSAKAAAQQIPHVMTRWMEKTVNSVILRKLTQSRITERSTDDEVLRLLGHVHCDAAKVDAVIALIVESPLQMMKHQRMLWLYIRELARRFGSDETKKAVATYLSKTLF